jgi:hypothetical protein
MSGILVLAMLVMPAAAQETPVEYQPLAKLAVDVVGIAVITGILFFLVRQSLPPDAKDWLFRENPWLVNLLVVVTSVAIANLGAWLNLMAFQPRTVTEYVWKGLFSAAVATFGYEFTKNLGRSE